MKKVNDLIKKFERLVEEQNWEKALPIIEQILNINKNISTSWINYATCLENLGRFDDARVAFFNAWALKPTDNMKYRMLYRILRTFVIAKDRKGFLEFVKKQYKDCPEILDLLIDTSDNENNNEFDDFINDIEFQEWLKSLNLEK